MYVVVVVVMVTLVVASDRAVAVTVIIGTDRLSKSSSGSLITTLATTMGGMSDSEQKDCKMVL